MTCGHISETISVLDALTRCPPARPCSGAIRSCRGAGSDDRRGCAATEPVRPERGRDRRPVPRPADGSGPAGEPAGHHPAGRQRRLGHRRRDAQRDHHRHDCAAERRPRLLPELSLRAGRDPTPEPGHAHRQRAARRTASRRPGARSRPGRRASTPGRRLAARRRNAALSRHAQSRSSRADRANRYRSRSASATARTVSCSPARRS